MIESASLSWGRSAFSSIRTGLGGFPGIAKRIVSVELELPAAQASVATLEFAAVSASRKVQLPLVTIGTSSALVSTVMVAARAPLAAATRPSNIETTVGRVRSFRIHLPTHGFCRNGLISVRAIRSRGSAAEPAVALEPGLYLPEPRVIGR